MTVDEALTVLQRMDGSSLEPLTTEEREALVVVGVAYKTDTLTEPQKAAFEAVGGRLLL